MTRKVVTLDGKPVAGARVLIRAFTGIFGEAIVKQEVHVTTDTQGMFAAKVDLSKAQAGYIMVDATGYALHFTPLFNSWSKGAEKQLRAESSIQLSPDYELSGKVLDANKRPVPNAQVVVGTLVNTNPPLLINRSIQGIVTPELMTKSSTDGTFKLRGINLGPTRRELVQANLWSTANAGGIVLTGKAALVSFRTLVFRSAQDYRGESALITLAPAISIGGQVVNALTGTPVGSARVRLAPGGEISQLSTITGAAGHFVFKEIPRGGYRLLISAAGFAATTVYASWAAEELATGAVNVIARVRPSAAIVGRVVDESTGEAPLAAIRIETAYKYDKYNPVERNFESDETIIPQEDGSFTRDLSVGSNTVHIYGPALAGYDGAAYDEQITLDVPPEGLKNLIIRVRRHPGFLLRLRWENDKSLYGCYLWAWLPDGREINSALSTLDFREEPRDYKDYFYPVAQWGRKMQIRVFRRIHLEKLIAGEERSLEQDILPLTEVVADPKQWPLTIRISQP